MNFLTSPMLRRKKVTRQALERDLPLSNGDLNTRYFSESADTYSLRGTSLPWEILETARFYFQTKGFEKTTILDICERLGIKKHNFTNTLSHLTRFSKYYGPCENQMGRIDVGTDNRSLNYVPEKNISRPL